MDLWCTSCLPQRWECSRLLEWDKDVLVSHGSLKCHGMGTEVKITCSPALVRVNLQPKVPLRPGPHDRHIRPNCPALIMRPMINHHRRPPPSTLTAYIPSPTCTHTCMHAWHGHSHAWLVWLPWSMSIFSMDLSRMRGVGGRTSWSQGPVMSNQ